MFWTKDPLKLMPYLDELDGMGYHYYFQFTLTPYGRDLEKNLRPKEALEKTFIRLSQRIGRERVVWRYDPIILNQQLDIRYHMEQFRRMCGKLSPYTDTVTVSFVDLYAKLKTPLIRPITREEMEALAAFFGCVSKEAGLNAVTCCENGDFTALTKLVWSGSWVVLWKSGRIPISGGVAAVMKALTSAHITPAEMDVFTAMPMVRMRPQHGIGQTTIRRANCCWDKSCQESR